MSVNDLECEALANEANIFFIESNSYNYTRVKSINDIRGNQKWEKRFQDKESKKGFINVPNLFIRMKQYYTNGKYSPESKSRKIVKLNKQVTILQTNLKIKSNILKIN